VHPSVDVVAVLGKLAYWPALQVIAIHYVASAPADYVPALQAVHPSVSVVAVLGKIAYWPKEHAIALQDVASAPAD